MRLNKTQFSGGLLLSFFALLSIASPSRVRVPLRPASFTPDTLRGKTGRRPINTNKDRRYSPLAGPKATSPLILQDPKGISTKISLDSAKKIAIIEQLSDSTNQRNIRYRTPENIPISDYLRNQRLHVTSDLWRENSKKQDGQSAVSGRGLNPKFALTDGLDRIFGKDFIDFKPNGNVTLDLGYLYQNNQDPSIPIQNRRQGILNFNEQVQINFNGKIGDNMNINANFDTKASFNFENKLKLNYRAKEEDIIQKIEVGNLSFQVPSQLIPGVNNLFGIKPQLRFGKLDVGLVAAQQRSKQQRLIIRNGVQNKGFEIRADQYDENRHFFLSQFFRTNYERALKTLPQIVSGVTITRLEVYVTNRTNSTDVMRNVLAVADLAEPNPYNKTNPNVLPIVRDTISNGANGLYKNIRQNTAIRQVDQTNLVMESQLGLQKGSDFELLRGAKRLTDREYRFHPELGYVSLVTPLRNDEVLAVAYEYTFRGRNYKVGELIEDYQDRKDDEVLVLKMLKSSTIRNNVTLPMWDLMMKNVYSLNTTNLQKQGFQLRVIYKDDLTGLDNPNLQEGRRTKDIPLLQVLGLDKLNFMGDPQPDGNVDFVEGVTIDSKMGKIIFPVLEPFGTAMRRQFDADESALTEKYVFDKLYRTTQIEATQTTEKNKFFLRGSLSSGMGGEVQLPFGVDPKSVRVSAGGSPLSEGTDYQIEPQSGRIRVSNPSVANSGQDIYVDYEQPDLFSNQIRTLLAGRFDYTLSNDIRFGATIMRYRETPPANLKRVSLGNEPTNNTIIGFDADYRKESRGLTRLLDKLPLIQTKETSMIDFKGEYARLIPAVAPRVLGRSYIDDFEGSRTMYDLARQPNLWRLGATPKEFSQASLTAPLAYNYRRAKMSVYTIDNTFYGLGGNFGNAPTNLTDDDLRNHYEKQVQPQSIFPQQAIANGFNIPLGVLDMYYNPTERGAYNYSTNLGADGRLLSPRQNFGSATRAVTSDIDFDNANIENVEFWMMNPFINNSRGIVKATGDPNIDKPNTTGGTMYLNLGDISEDIMPDGRYNFENGLPIVDKITQNSPGIQRNVDVTPWGHAPRTQFVTRAFSNQPEARTRQDVGLDGLSNAEEKTFFQQQFLSRLPANLTAQARAEIERDPSADDYEFAFSEEANTSNKKIVQRFKNYMGYENNTPELDRQNTTTAETNNYLPDVEDINTDNTINDNEAYYQYKLDLRPSTMEVGQGYIVDKVQSDGADWYLYRIPIRNFTSRVGSITGFKSIRFMRMFLTDFEQPVVLRFVKFQMSGYQYRKYLGDLTRRSLTEVPEPYDAGFRVQTVSIEENGPSDKTGTDIIPYVLPPGFERDRDLTTINNAELNEQSMSLSVTNLRDGDSRGVFKNVNLDLINYKRLKMWVHSHNAESESDKTAVFLRLGTDLTENYYEVELRRLKATDPSSVNKSQPEPEKVWPIENTIDVAFDDLRRVKSERNRSAASLTQPFSLNTADSLFTIRVIGNPDLSAIQNIMIGLRNPKSGDEQPKSFTVWVNELLAEGFDQTSGQAAIGRLNLKLADIATVSLSGSMKTYGFGGVTDKISQRVRDNSYDYNIQAAVQLDKLTPEKWGLKIPLYVNYSKQHIAPNFNPLDPDMPLETSLENLSNNPERQEKVRTAAQDNTVRKGINLSNVRKVKTNPEAKNHAYDVENFAFTYAHSEVNRTSPMIEEYRQEVHRGAITYQYQPQSKPIEPFKNAKNELLKDFNLSLIPNNITVSADMDRSFTKTLLRNSDLDSKGVAAQFEKYWLFNRRYDLGWNLTRNITANYRAQSNAIIDEPRGDIDTPYKQDSVWQSLARFGRTKAFDQRMDATYRIPLDKIRLLDWLTADYNVRIAYGYTMNSFALKDTSDVEFGNIIKNNRDQTLQGRIDFVKLYNKVKYLKFANTPRPPKKNFTRSPGDFEELPPEPGPVAKGATRLLMAVRGIRYTYSVRESTTLPGFLPGIQFLGMNQELQNAPGLGFVTGSQNPDIRYRAADNGWLSKSIMQNVPFLQTVEKRLDLRADIEPWKEFKVALTANFTRGDNYSEFFRPDMPGGPFVSQSPVRSGNFSMSFFSFGSSFDKNAKDNTSATFQRFLEYRDIIKQRLEAANSENAAISPEKRGQYNDRSQDVLIPAFFAAYAKRDPETVSFSPFYKIPFPNWRLDYTGLVKSFPELKKFVNDVTITHSFTSTYNVGTFTSSLEYGADRVGFNSPLYPFAVIANLDRQLVPVYAMSIINITERFAPFLGVQIRTKGNTTIKIDYNQERNVSLNLSSATIGDLSTKALVMGFSVTRNNVRLPFRDAEGKNVVLANDLRLDFNLTINDTRDILRKVDGEVIPRAGGYMFQLSPKITYKVNKRLDLSMYLDRMVNDPLVTNAYYRSTTAGGFRLRFDLAQ